MKTKNIVAEAAATEENATVNLTHIHQGGNDNMMNKINENTILETLGDVVSCLNVISSRCSSLKTTLMYIEDRAFHEGCQKIFNLETALQIDAVGQDYSSNLGAEAAYKAAEAEQKFRNDPNVIYNMDGNGMISIDGEKISVDEYYEKLQSQYTPYHIPSKNHLQYMYKVIRGEYRLLTNLKNIVLNLLKTYSWDEGPDSFLDDTVVSGYIDADGVFWEQITFRGTGKSFLKVSTTEIMEHALTETGEDRIYMEHPTKDETCKYVYNGGTLKKKEYLYCDAPYFDADYALKARYVLCAHFCEEPGFLDEQVTEHKWIKICHKNDTLKQYIKDHR